MSRTPSDRGRGPGSGAARPDPATETRDDAASADHRRKLEALFSGGGSAKALVEQTANGRATPPAERVFASPRRSLGRSPSEFRMRLERLRIAREPAAIKEAADLFLQHHQLPDDPEILTKVMQHPDQKVVREAMGQISALVMQGRMGPTLLLEDRLRELDSQELEPATRSYVQGLKGQLASAKK